MIIVHDPTGYVTNFRQKICQVDTGDALHMHWLLASILVFTLAWLHTSVMLLQDKTHGMIRLRFYSPFCAST